MADFTQYNDLIDIILTESRQMGVDCELMFCAGKAVGISAFNGALEKFTHATSQTLGIRVVVNAREGISYTERIDIPAARDALHEAIANAELCESKPFVAIAKPPKTENISSHYNPELPIQASIEQLKAIAIELETSAKKADERIVNVPHAGAGYNEGELRIVSTQGTDCTQSANSVYAYVYILADDGKEKRTGGESKERTQWDLKPEDLVSEAVRDTLNLLNSQTLPISGKSKVLISREAFASLLDAYAGIFSARTVIEGLSPLKEKCGTLIASPHFTLIDDPQMKEAVHQTYIDSEGFPTRALTLIDHGKLCCFLHNSQTATELNLENNARASRSPKSSLGVSRTNWRVDVDIVKPIDTIAAENDEFVYIYSFEGLHAGVNVISGDFSLMAEGFYYKNGKRQYSLRPFTVSGNFNTLIQNILCACDDVKMLESNIQTPSLFVDTLSVSG